MRPEWGAKGGPWSPWTSFGLVPWGSRSLHGPSPSRRQAGCSGRTGQCRGLHCLPGSVCGSPKPGGGVNHLPKSVHRSRKPGEVVFGGGARWRLGLGGVTRVGLVVGFVALYEEEGKEISLSPRVRARGRAVTKDPAGWHLDLGLPPSGAVRNQACGLSPAVHGFDGSLSRRSQSAAGHGHGGGRGGRRLPRSAASCGGRRLSGPGVTVSL